MRQIITTTIGGNGKVRDVRQFLASVSPEVLEWLEPYLANLDPSAPWLLKVTWEWERGGQPQAVQMELRAKDGQPITATFFRKVIAGALEESRKELLQMMAIVSNLSESLGAEEAAARARDIDSAAPRSGRKPKLQLDHPDLFADVARHYMRQRLNGAPKIIKAVEEDLRADPKYADLMKNGGSDSDNRVRGWINRAKQMDLIRPAKGKNDG